MKNELALHVAENRTLRGISQGLQSKTKTLLSQIEKYGIIPPKNKIDYKILRNKTEADLEKNCVLMEVQEAIRLATVDNIERPGKIPCKTQAIQTDLMDIDMKIVYDYKFGQ